MVRPAGSILRCSGCGAEVDADELLPFRCPRAGSPGDHVLVRKPVVDGPDAPAWPADDDPEEQPFVRYREMLHPYGFARRRGLSDSDYVTLVRDLDDAVAAVDGHGFRLTPFGFAPDLDARLALEPATTLVKDETDNVSGSHKGRHLFGLALQITLAGRFGALDRWPPRLAIASCGNAALAAAVVARAARWPLSVFVPPTANEFVLGRLDALGAEVVECPRVPGDPPGDPCVRRFRAAVAAGALPFSCQGPENGLTVDGGRTLAYEIVDGLRAAQLGAGAAAPIPAVDAPGGAALGRDVCLYVQVGGGAMAAGLAAGFEDAAALGCLGRDPRLPRFVAVQTEGAAPLARAYRRVAADLGATVYSRGGPERFDGPQVRVVPGPGARAAIEAALGEAALRRAEYMWPWENEPASAAGGILDDETYDWLAVVRAMLLSGGYPVVAPERVVLAAEDLAHATGIDADATGTAGLAGLLTDLGLGRRPPPGARVVLLFTGAGRPAGGSSAPSTTGS